MKLISKKLHYTVRSNEVVGMWSEKIICDIVNIKFNTKRDYININEYPYKLRKDLYCTLNTFLGSLQIKQHIGNKNENCDFVCKSGSNLSLKTNINSFKVCPAKIGQTTLQKLNKHFRSNFTNQEFKAFVMSNTNTILTEYLKYSFTCEHLISIKFDTGKVYYFQAQLENLQWLIDDYQFTCTLESWNESNTVKIKIGETFVSLAEFQIHQKRNCIKCRFNFDTIILLIKLGFIKGIHLQEFDLKYKYIIKVVK